MELQMGLKEMERKTKYEVLTISAQMDSLNKIITAQQ